MYDPLTSRAIDFLWELSLNNQRPWFQEHKEEYRRVLEHPFRSLAQETAGLMQAHWPKYGFQPRISRIYRDARRLFGRGPYHDHLWFSLQRMEAASRGPMLWFELGLEGSSHGLGFWDQTAAQAEAFRRHMDRDLTRFERLVNGIPHREQSRLWGEEYKRPKGDRGELLNPWYNRRHLSVGYENFFGDRLFDRQLPELLAESFSGLMPMYDFFLEVWAAEPGPMEEHR